MISEASNMVRFEGISGWYSTLNIISVDWRRGYRSGRHPSDPRWSWFTPRGKWTPAQFIVHLSDGSVRVRNCKSNTEAKTLAVYAANFIHVQINKLSFRGLYATSWSIQ